MVRSELVASLFVATWWKQYYPPLKWERVLIARGPSQRKKKTGGRVNGSNKTNDSVFFFQGAWDEGRPRFDPAHSKKRGRDAIFFVASVVFIISVGLIAPGRLLDGWWSLEMMIPVFSLSLSLALGVIVIYCNVSPSYCISDTFRWRVFFFGSLWWENVVR